MGIAGMNASGRVSRFFLIPFFLTPFSLTPGPSPGGRRERADHRCDRS